VHGLHALAALVALGWALLRLRRSVLPPSMLAAAALFWYFVVGVWPIVYLRVYR
jgi:heme/copper-type cytochrome/quinol oxidase subunit 3